MSMESIVKPFILGSVAINVTFMHVLEKKLGLPQGTFEALHKPNEQSGSEARVTHSPPITEDDKKEVYLMAHTDFGSIVRPSIAPLWQLANN